MDNFDTSEEYFEQINALPSWKPGRPDDAKSRSSKDSKPCNWSLPCEKDHNIDPPSDLGIRSAYIRTVSSSTRGHGHDAWTAARADEFADLLHGSVRARILFPSFPHHHTWVKSRTLGAVPRSTSVLKFAARCGNRLTYETRFSKHESFSLIC